MRLAALAACLALACTPALAQSRGSLHTWAGPNLRYAFPTFPDCREVVVVEASSFSGVVRVDLRNNSSVPIEITIEGQIHGAPPAVRGVATITFRPGQVAGRALMTTTARDLTGSTLEVRVIGCHRR